MRNLDHTRTRRTLAAVCIATAIASAVLAFVGSSLTRTPTERPTALRARRVVIFTVPGVTWRDVRRVRTPVLDRLTATGASSALAPRSATVRPSPIRGYLTLGAGNRAAASNDSVMALSAYDADERLMASVTAEDMLGLRVGRHRTGAVVHLGIAELNRRQAEQYHGTQVGAMGEALAREGVPTGVVSAAARSVRATDPEATWGAPVLGIIDRRGVVTHGVVSGLVEPSADGAFGVRTDRRAFGRAVARTLRSSRVVLVEPGETVRTDGFAPLTTPAQAARLRDRALERADTLLGDVVDLLQPSDLLLVVGSSSAFDQSQEHLTPVIATGSSVTPGFLVSATTHRPGIVTLTDIAPTALDAIGVRPPSVMSGRPMRSAGVTRGAAADLSRVHDELDARSAFRERFAPVVFYAFVALFVILSALVGLVFLARLRLIGALVAMCYIVLALPLATFLLSLIPLWRVGPVGAQAVLWGLAIVCAALAGLAPGPRWTGALVLLIATSVFVATDLMSGGHLVVNAVFGNSVLAAGRFYGIPNTGSALFFGASVLALGGVGEVVGARRWRAPLVAGLVVVLLITGLPMFGADVGGLLTGVAAIAAIVLVSRGERLPWRMVVLVIVLAVGVTLAIAWLDSLRPVDQQTHLGRFADQLFGDGTVATQVILRKASQSLSSLGFSRFTYVIPLGVAALAVLLRRPRGPLREVLPRYPLFRAGLAGLLVAGVLGFALNDSGVAVPALLLAQAVPLVVLLGVDHARLVPDAVVDSGSPPKRVVDALERKEREHTHQVRAEVDGDPDK